MRAATYGFRHTTSEGRGKTVLTNGKLLRGAYTTYVICVSNRDFTLSSIFAGNNNASGTMIDDKSKQWFGASVHSSGQDGIIVVRWHSFT